jgi:transposase
MRGALERLTQVEAENTALRAQVAGLQKDLEEANRKVEYLLKRLFGTKSETIDPRQLELLLSGIESTPAPEPPAVVRDPRSPRRKASPRKPRIPENLPTEDIVIDPEEVKADPASYRLIGEEITQELDVVPPRYFRRRFIRRKYVSKLERALAPVIAELPPRLIEGGYAGVGLLTDIAAKKYLEHLPLYRQEQILRLRYGIELSRKTMCDWMGQVAWWLKPIYERVAEDLKGSKYLQIDETPVRYCQAEGGGSGQGYLWVYHRPGGGVLYEWHTGRGADCLETMLKDFGGTIQTDGYGAYGSFVKKRQQEIVEGQNKPPIIPSACWAHARRKFDEALQECPVQAGWILRQLQNLYRIEKRLRGTQAGPALRQAVRASESDMIVSRIGKALQAKRAQHRPTSQMGKAIAYTLSLWKELNVYLHDGRVEIDNNGVENAIRPTALGKKNYLFFGHPEAGERSAVFYTLLENCKREGISPHEYLYDVLSRRPTTPMDRIDELTPAKWAAARKEKVA